MDILTGLAIIVIASSYLAFIITGLLKAKRRDMAAARAGRNERRKRAGFVIEDDYPPQVK